ncbi:MAG: hypothetical protein ACLFO1_01455 [Spirochaetaceae bacterium]
MRRSVWPGPQVVLVAVAILACLISGGSHAQDAADGSAEASQEEPAWIIYEEGVHHLRNREYGEAMQAFRRAISVRGGAFPEAEAGIGRIFSAENQIDLAARQFRRALEQKAFFYVPAQEYVVRYELAELHRNRGVEGRYDYQAALEAIVADDQSFSDRDNRSLRRGYRRTLEDDGVDRLLVLYRLEEDFTRRAHHLLGEHYLAGRNFSTAADHLMYATLMVFSTAIEEVRRGDPGYQFEAVAGFLDRLEREETVRAYLEEAEAYRILYHLATAVYGADISSRTPQDIWAIIAEEDAAGQWARMARRQLDDPRSDRYVDY